MMNGCEAAYKLTIKSPSNVGLIDKLYTQRVLCPLGVGLRLVECTALCAGHGAVDIAKINSR